MLYGLRILEELVSSLALSSRAVDIDAVPVAYDHCPQILTGRNENVTQDR